MHPSPSQRATARVQFVYYLCLSAPGHSERPSSASSVHDTYSWHLLRSAACTTQCRLTVQSRLLSSLRRRRTPVRKIHCVICRAALDGMVCGSPAIVSLQPTFGYVSGDKPLVKYRLCMPRAALATKMMVVLWNRGTCSHTVKMCAVAPPLCRLDKKTLPGLRTLPSFLIAGGGAGFA